MEYTVIFHDGGNVLPAYTKTVASGTSIPLPNPPGKTDYTFNGWKENNIGAALPPSTSYPVIADVNFYADWTFTGVTPGVVNIISVGELAAINASSANLAKHYRLMENINLSGYSSGTGWTPIGTSATPFTGIFDGNNKTISGLTINDPLNDYVGLFGYISGAEITDLTVVLADAGITGKTYAGGIAGYASGSVANPARIENSHIQTSGTGSITVSGSSDARVGGVVGYASYITIRECSNAAAINSSSAAGGIVGSVSIDTGIYNSRNTGAVTATAGTSINAYAGGIAGYAYSAFITGSHNNGAISATGGGSDVYAGGITGYGNNITDSYNTENVGAGGYDNTYAGGITGYASSDLPYSMLRNYNQGIISAVSSNRPAYAGGIAGELFSGSILDSYNIGTVSAATNSPSSGYTAYAGGITGYQNGGMFSDTTVSKNYNTGDITASSTNGKVCVAGIAGYAYDGNNITLTKNAAANGSVTGTTSDTIGINRILACIEYSSSTIEYNFAFKDMSGGTFADVPQLKGEEKEAADFKKKNTYSNDTLSGGLGWKFGSNDENPWTMPTPDGSDYPRLYWQTD
jgi:uncharacterized repeat protein (TIGR02543 family)